jgi:hypothetical protein
MLAVGVVAGAMVSMAALPAGASVSIWPPLPGNTWTLNGTGSVDGSGNLFLTTDGQFGAAGSAWDNTVMNTANLDVQFTATISPAVHANGSTGADGMVLVFANPADTQTTALGDQGGGLGFTGVTGGNTAIDGVGIALDTYQNNNDPSNNFVGIITGGTDLDKTWAATVTNTNVSSPNPGQYTNTYDSSLPSLFGTHTYQVTYVGGVLEVLVDGSPVLHTTISLPSTSLVGFTGSTGGITDSHEVSAYSVSNDGGQTPTPSGGVIGGIAIAVLVAVGFTAITLRRRMSRRTVTARIHGS